MHGDFVDSIQKPYTNTINLLYISYTYNTYIDTFDYFNVLSTGRIAFNMKYENIHPSAVKLKIES